MPSEVKKLFHTSVTMNLSPLKIGVFLMLVAFSWGVQADTTAPASGSEPGDSAVNQTPAGTSLQSRVANIRADVKICDDNIRQLATYVKKLRRQNRNLKNRLSQTEKRLADVEKQIAELREALAEERQNRKKAMKQIAGSLSKQINTTLDSAGQTDAQHEKDQNIQGTYTVSPGDTLSMIGAAYGVSPEKIRQLNDLKGDTIYPGQKLFIPEKTSEGGG